MLWQRTEEGAVVAKMLWEGAVVEDTLGEGVGGVVAEDVVVVSHQMRADLGLENGPDMNLGLGGLGEGNGLGDRIETKGCGPENGHDKNVDRQIEGNIKGDCPSRKINNNKKMTNGLGVQTLAMRRKGPKTNEAFQFLVAQWEGARGRTSCQRQLSKPTTTSLLRSRDLERLLSPRISSELHLALPSLDSYYEQSFGWSDYGEDDDFEQCGILERARGRSCARARRRGYFDFRCRV
nr:hypothetical protein Iba_chr13eCG10510 [Ipomoea batatas]